MPPLRLLERVVDVVLPPLCVHCAEPLPRARPGVCRWCRATLKPVSPGCRRCGLPRPGSPDSCARCDAWPEGLSAVAATRYSGAAESMAHALKYTGWSHLADVCADAMARALRERAGEIGAVAPVPLHPTRLRERGFNQSELLARSLARSLRVPVVDALVRVRSTRSQVGLGRSARQRNVEAAFATADGFLPRGVLALVDDVATSGATLAAAGGALREAGAERIVAVTFALALPGPPR